jgi:hypothetical protein
MTQQINSLIPSFVGRGREVTFSYVLWLSQFMSKRTEGNDKVKQRIVGIQADNRTRDLTKKEYWCQALNRASTVGAYRIKLNGDIIVKREWVRM